MRGALHRHPQRLLQKRDLRKEEIRSLFYIIVLYELYYSPLAHVQAGTYRIPEKYIKLNSNEIVSSSI